MTLQPDQHGSGGVDTFRSGVVAIVGAPNAGKSTLLNRIVGAKISIVTPKVQTTRARVRGVWVDGPVQIVFIDTPGIFQPRRMLDRAMVQAAWAGAEDADAVLVLVDAPEEAARPEGVAARNTNRILEGLKGTRSTAILVLNKVDAMKRELLLPLAARLTEGGHFTETFMVSAEKGQGVEALLAFLSARMPPAPWLFPADQLADLPLRLLAAEITREKLFLRVHDELPYASSVETETWTAQKDGSVRIEQTIYVERDGQKAIVIGKNGSTIKDIGQKARAEIELMLGHRAHLFLNVKVRPDWASEGARLRAIGLEPPLADEDKR